MGRQVRPCAMDDSAVESISERLSTIADLHMPHSFASRSESVSSGEKKLHLSSLLRRDAAVFLGRSLARSLNLLALSECPQQLLGWLAG